MNARQFGQSVKAARLAQELTRLELGRKSSVRLFSIYCIEEEHTADRYPVATCQKLADALGLELGLDK